MSSLEITVDTEKTPAVIALSGRLDTTTAPEFQEAAEKVIHQGVHDLIVDLKDCAYVSSAGLRVIVVLQKLLINGRLVFRSINPEVMEVLDMTGISQVITIA